MASAPTRRCPKCRQLVQGKCEKCSRKTKANHDRHRGTARQRGYSHQWEKARALHLQQEPLCRECRKQGRVTAASVVDHIEPHRGDQELFWDRDNWQSLCETCHNAKTGRGG